MHSGYILIKFKLLQIVSWLIIKRKENVILNLKRLYVKDMNVIKFIRKVIGIITSITMTCSLLLVILAVVFRYVLGNPIIWAETVSRMLFIWTVFLGASLCYERGSMFSVELFKNASPILILLRKVVEIFVVIIMIYGSYELIPFISKQYISVFSDFFPFVNMSWSFIAIPVGLFLLLVEVILSLYGSFFSNKHREI